MTTKKEWATQMKALDPDYFRKLARKSHEAWEENGRKPQGFKKNPELASEAGKKGALVSKGSFKYDTERAKLAGEKGRATRYGKK